MHNKKLFYQKKPVIHGSVITIHLSITQPTTLLFRLLKEQNKK
jgi:hypothetical protein